MEGKHLLIGGLALAATVIAVAAARAANTGAKLELSPEAKLRRLDFAGLQVEVDAAYRNPTKGSITLRDPVVTLRLPDGGADLMRLDLAGQALTISPSSEGRLSDPGQLGGKILVQVPYQTVLELAPQAVKAMLGLAPPFKVEVVTQALVEAPNLPRFRHTVRQTVTIQSPVA